MEYLLLNETIIRYFGDEALYGASRVYFYILRRKRSVLSKKDVQSAAKYLNMNTNTFMNYVGQLKKIGAIRKVTSSRWLLVAWRKFIPNHYHRVDKKRSKRNRMMIVSWNVLKSIKAIRELTMGSYIKQATAMSFKNRTKVDNLHNSAKRELDRLVPCSSSFIAAVCNLNKSDRTINRYLNKLKENGVFKVQQQIRVHASYETYKEAANHRNNAFNSRLFISKVNNIYYRVYEVLSNKVGLKDGYCNTLMGYGTAYV